MFNAYNNYNTVISFIYSNVVGGFSYYYLSILTCVLGLFLIYRFPYCYSSFFFGVFLLVIVLSMFVSLMCRRVFDNINDFFSSFIPVGTPIYICPLVCIAETISYMIRPIVLILRPFINISLGCLGAVSLGSLCFINVSWLIVLALLFFYEVFVAIVHWYIVTSILSFSVDH